MSILLDPCQLPSVSLANRKQLPQCSAIYFAIDEQNRVLYVGQAKNLLSRWKNHHRLYSLEEKDKESPVRIAWKVWNQETLDEAEKILIMRFQPLLNNTKVETPAVVPSEEILIDFLRGFSRRLIILGIEPKTPNKLPSIHLKFDPNDFSSKGTAARIKEYIQEARDKNTSLKFKRHKIYRDFDAFAGQAFRPGSREQRAMARRYRAFNNHWEFGCNGVIIHISPEDLYREYKEQTHMVKLAGVNCRAITQNAFPSVKNGYSHVIVSSLSCFIDDPIPLLWKR